MELVFVVVMSAGLFVRLLQTTGIFSSDGDAPPSEDSVSRLRNEALPAHAATIAEYDALMEALEAEEASSPEPLPPGVRQSD